MIVGIGIDITEIDRIAKGWGRFGDRFARRILHPHEVVRMPAANPVAFLAGRFAVKEAAVKALGTGFSDGIGPRDIEVGVAPAGAPQLVLHGKAAARMEVLGATRTHVSLTHGRDTAAAVVILES